MTTKTISALLSDKEIEAVARCLADRSATQCGTDAKRHWEWYSDDFREQAIVAITALRAIEAAVLARAVSDVQPVEKPKLTPELKVIYGEICYKSEFDDYSFGMWCPLNYNTEHSYKNGDEFYLFDKSSIAVLQNALLLKAVKAVIYYDEADEEASIEMMLNYADALDKCRAAIAASQSQGAAE